VGGRDAPEDGEARVHDESMLARVLNNAR
jgi:hypothetical protein